MARTLTAILVVTLLHGGLALADQPANEFDRLLSRYHELGQFNGVALVVREGATVLRKGYGLANHEWQAPNAPDTRMLAGSVTKALTSLLIARLAARGELSLDSTVSDYLPWYRDDTGSKITLTHLLAHTDGLPNYTADSDFWRSYEGDLPYSTREFILRYCSGDLQFEPGTQNRYGNAGFSILGAVVEAVTGESLAAVMSREVFGPLGMGNSGLHRPGTAVARLASGYQPYVDGYAPATPIYKPLFAAGSLYTTVDDLERLHRALSATASEDLARLLFDERTGAVDGTFAYGWNVGETAVGDGSETRRYMMTNGEVNGYNAFMLRLPEDDHLVVLLNNTGETSLLAMASNLVAPLYGLAPDDPAPRAFDRFLEQLGSDAGAAADFYRRARDENPRDYLFFPWPLRILAGQLVRDGRYDIAITVMQLNLETSPNDLRSLLILTRAQLLDGNREAARKTAEQVLEIDPGNIEAREMLERAE